MLDVFSRFSLAVQGEIAKIRIRSRFNRDDNSVLLTDSTKIKIQHYVSRIRDLVEKSDLSPGEKKRLNEKLDKLTAELGSQRLSLAKTMLVLSVVLAGLSNVVTIAAEGQSAVGHILELIGHDKETEDAAAKRLAPPLKALPAPAKPAVHPAKPLPPKRLSEVIDDDIPF